MYYMRYYVMDSHLWFKTQHNRHWQACKLLAHSLQGKYHQALCRILDVLIQNWSANKLGLCFNRMANCCQNKIKTVVFFWSDRSSKKSVLVPVCVFPCRVTIVTSLNNHARGGTRTYSRMRFTFCHVGDQILGAYIDHLITIYPQFRL